MSVQKNILLAALAGCLSVSCASTAADWKPAPFRAGQQRLAIGTNTFSQKTVETNSGDFDSDALRLNGSYGYFYQPNVEVGAMVSYTDSEVGTAETTEWILNGFARYWIDTRNSTRPFLQGRVGVGNTESTFIQGQGTSKNDDLVEYGIGIGLSDFISQSTSLDLLLEWADQQYDNTDVQTDGLELSVAFSFYF